MELPFYKRNICSDSLQMHAREEVHTNVSPKKLRFFLSSKAERMEKGPSHFKTSRGITASFSSMTSAYVSIQLP
jgi:hypothetical protein